MHTFICSNLNATNKFRSKCVVLYIVIVIEDTLTKRKLQTYLR